MKSALLDTNFLMIPGRFKVDVFSELDRLGYKPVILSCVLDELGNIAKRRGKAAGYAKIALEILDARKPEVTEAAGPVDSALLEHGSKSHCAIATNDALLIARAKKKSISVLRLRQKKYVAEA